MENERKLFIVGLKLVGVLNIIWGGIAFINVIPVLADIISSSSLPYDLANPFYHTISPLVQIAIGIYLLKDGRAIENFAFGQDSSVQNDN